MELKLEQEQINCYRMVLDTEVHREETTEAIVPDACPDIDRIVDAGGHVCLNGKQIRDGGGAVTGTVMGWVLYYPEGGEELCRMEVKLPFSIRAESEELREQTLCMAVPFLRNMDARALNPRKILVRADIGLSLQAYEPRELLLCRGIACNEGDGVQQRTCQHASYLTVGVREKEFTFYDELHLSAGPAGRAQILCVSADPCCSEARVIGSRLIFKGEAVVQVRYLVGTELYSARCPMPFSQVVELENVGEAADCDLSLCLTGTEWVQAAEDGRTLNVTLELLAQATVRENIPVTVLQDCYSTTCPMQVHRENCILEQLTDRGVQTQSVRELLEADTPAKSVIDASVTPIGMERRQADGTLRAELRVRVLYLDELDRLQVLNRTMTASGHLELPSNGVCRCSCRCPGEVFAVPAAGGIEVRFAPEFHCLLTQSSTVPVVAGVEPELSAEEARSKQPSVVLRMAAAGEDLWDIAKACGTTQDSIRKANALEEDAALPVGQMLLIPTVR